MNKKRKNIYNLLAVFIVIMNISTKQVKADTVAIDDIIITGEIPLGGISKVLHNFHNYDGLIKAIAENTYSKKDLNILFRIVEAECTGGSLSSKINVANVILNRVDNKSFPNTIKEVVFQKNQFSPISDGRYYDVKITNETKQAVYKAIVEEDTTNGALFFCNKKYVKNLSFKSWFSTLKYLFTDDINHSFYK